jgi:inhibitor of cysteine peptidase
VLRFITALSEVAVIVGLLSACSAPPAPGVTPKKLTEADTGSQVELRVGDSFEVMLAGNPTTGYQWEVSELDTSIVKQVGEAAYEPASSATGAGGHFTYQFQAVNAGQTPLRLVYRRPFETDTPPVQTFDIQVVVK